MLDEIKSRLVSARMGYDAPSRQQYVADVQFLFAVIADREARICERTAVETHKESSWIDAEELKPDEAGYYLVRMRWSGGARIVIAEWNGRQWWDTSEGCTDSGEVTHWMPLLEPPVILERSEHVAFELGEGS